MKHAQRSKWLETVVYGIAHSRIALIGLIVTLCALPIAFGATVLILLGVVENPYFTIINNLILVPLSLLGLLLFFSGLFILPKKARISLLDRTYLITQLQDDASFDRLCKIGILILVLSVTSLFFIGTLTFGGYRYMESVGFCGTTCHSVMHPEYSAYQRSLHSNVPCVECHIGEGARWFVKSKLSGTRQIFAVLFKTYDKPILTPIIDLRPAKETCQRCHRPEAFAEDKLVLLHKTLPDRDNTSVTTALLLKVGSAGDRVVSPRGIHWHSAQQIAYTALDRRRSIISEVVYRTADGSEKTYRAASIVPPGVVVQSQTRKMDCLDCHNRPSHRFLTAEEALDHKFERGELPREIPFLKREALTLVTRSYASSEEARSAIARGLTTWYTSQGDERLLKNRTILDKAIAGVQAAYEENVFPAMNVGWGTYRSLATHGPDFDQGCFRCHGSKLKSDSGEEISADCDTCHIVLADKEQAPVILKTLRRE